MRNPGRQQDVGVIKTLMLAPGVRLWGKPFNSRTIASPRMPKFGEDTYKTTLLWDSPECVWRRLFVELPPARLGEIK